MKARKFKLKELHDKVDMIVDQHYRCIHASLDTHLFHRMKTSQHCERVKEYEREKIDETKHLAK